MTPQQHIDHLAAESARLGSVAMGSLDRRIDHIDDWTIRDLISHLGAVYSWAIANLTAQGTEPVAAGPEAKAPEGEAINEWFAERHTTLLATLGAVDPDTAVWTFTGIKTVDWWKRRMAHETAVHRWDVEAAVHGAEATQPIDSDLASDGVDEYLDVSLRHSSSRPDRDYPSETLHLHRTDGPGEWMLVADGDGGVAVTHEHGKGDAAVRGPASALVLWMWGRPTSEVEIFGDEAVADGWRSLAP